MEIRNEVLAESGIQVVYELIDPVTDEIVYVGKTSQPRARYRGHTRPVPSLKELSPVNKWSIKLAQDGHEPIMNIVCRATSDSRVARFYETVRIRQLLMEGARLLNRRLTTKASAADLIDRVLIKYDAGTPMEDMEPELTHLYVRELAPGHVRESWIKRYGSLP